MTTVTQALLFAPSYLGASDASVYTVPAATIIKIGRAVFTNTSAVATTITAGITALVPLTGANTMIAGRNIAPGESYVSPELAGAVLSAGTALHAFAGATNSVNLEVSGITIM